jgi:histidyl-tRNA synthetase
MNSEGNSAYTPPRGMRDIAPVEMAKRRFVRSKIEEILSLYGYNFVDPTHVEKLETLFEKAGPEIEKEIYAFEDKGGRRLGLRFELTVGIARMVATNPDWPKPLRIASISTVWRYDEPQYGRYRSIEQWDVELFGTESPSADAEIIEICSRVMDSLGLDNFEIIISDRRILDSFLESLGLEGVKTDVMRVLDKRGKISESQMREQLKALELDESQISSLFELTSIRGEVFQVVDKLGEYPFIEKPVLDRMEEIGRVLEGTIDLERIVFDLSLVRGLDYYTGFIFECFDRDDLSLGSILGGGRFDRLVGLYGRDSPAVGCAGGITRLIMSLESKGLIPDDVVPVPLAYVTPITEKEMSEAKRIASILREAGIPTVVEVMGRKLRKALDSANKLGYGYTVIVGGRDIEKGVVTVRDMRTGEEKVVPIDDASKPILNGRN